MMLADQMVAAKNPKTPAEALERLATDGCDDVRLAVAAHWNTPRHILQRLAADPHPNVRQLALMRLAETHGLAVKIRCDITGW